MASVALSEIERKNVVTRLRDLIRAVNGFYWLFNVEATVSQVLSEFLGDDRSCRASWDSALKLQLWKEAVK